MDTHNVTNPNGLKAAREVFDAFAGTGKDDPLPNDALSVMQVRLHRWQVNNFGPTTDERFALGMIEEIGELWEATTKELQTDALGDVMVYGSQLLTSNRLGLRIVVRECNKFLWVRPHLKGGESMKTVGRFAHTILKGAQKIRKFKDLDREKEKEAYRAAVFEHVVRMFIIAGRAASYTDVGPAILEVGETVLKRTKGHSAIPEAAS